MIPQSAQHRIVSTEAFWEKMCDLRFVRLDRQRGAIGSIIYHVATPPEEVPGFMAAKRAETLALLGSPNKPAIFPFWVFALGIAVGAVLRWAWFLWGGS